MQDSSQNPPIKTIINDGPDDTCFGCGHRNEFGLKMVFEHEPGGETRATYLAPAHLGGAPGVVHGGIQATLLDELLGVAVQEYHVAGGAPDADHVTVDFSLSYRAPVPTGATIRMSARVVRVDGRDTWAEGEIIDAEDAVLTRAEARWRRLRAPAA